MRIVKTKADEKEIKDDKHVLGTLPPESLDLSIKSNFEMDMIKEAFACVAIRGST